MPIENLRLLIVNDHLATRNSVKRIAKDVGYRASHIFEAATEADALAQADGANPDIGIVDVHLSESNRREGLHVMQYLREVKNCVVIGMTADERESVQVEALDASDYDLVPLTMSGSWCEYLGQKLYIWSHVILRRQQRGVQQQPATPQP